MAESKLLRYNKWEYMMPILAVISLITSCVIISSKKHFWNDELYSYYLISDPSFSGMLNAFNDKINNSPILYFFMGWFWDKVFGSSELSYRLFSSLGMCIALGTVWITLRRSYNFWPTSIGTLGVFCTSREILPQNAEARMYGLFLAVCALAFNVYDRFYRKREIPFKILIVNAAVHMAILHTHLYGIFYSGAFLFSLLLSDRYYKIFRPRIYLSILLSWLSFLLYIPAFLIQADAGNPSSWLPVPLFYDLLAFYDLASYFKITILPILFFISALHYVTKTRDIRSPLMSKKGHRPDSEVALLILSCVLLILPVLIWIVSRTIKPIFWERYMIPGALGVAMLLSFVSSRLISTPTHSNILRDATGNVKRFLRASIVPLSLIMLTGYLLWKPVKYAKDYPVSIKPGFNDDTYGYPDLPVITQRSHDFLERQFYSPLRNKYFIILDWEAASDAKSGVWGPQQFKHLTALKQNYPDRFKNNILTTGEFLKRYDRFLVMSYFSDTIKCPLKPMGLNMAQSWIGLDCPQWVEMRLNNTAYKMTTLGKTSTYYFSLVEKFATGKL